MNPGTKRSLIALTLAALVAAIVCLPSRKPAIILNGVTLTGTDIIGLPQTNRIELRASVAGLIHRKDDIPWIHVAIPANYPLSRSITAPGGWQINRDSDWVRLSARPKNRQSRWDRLPIQTATLDFPELSIPALGNAGFTTQIQIRRNKEEIITFADVAIAVTGELREPRHIGGLGAKAEILKRLEAPAEHQLRR